jgi:glycosyltransferase involved in cell wall biosynthesis
MKILIVQDYLRSGGTERQSVLLANAFATAGHQATLLTFRPDGVLAGAVHGNVTHRALQSSDLHLDWFAPRLTHTMLAAEPDIVLCMGRMANCYAGSLQRTSDLTQHPANVIATMRTGKKLPWLFRRSLRRVAHIVANSREARETLVARHAVSPDRISVIYNSLVFSAEAFSPETTAQASAKPAELREKFGAGSATTVLLCVAMFRPEKNQRELVEIVDGLPRDADWQLWLAGEGPARAACEQLVAEKKLAARVKFLGLQRDPSPLYRAADLAVHASWSEALSNFLIEAQAHGLPAVAFAAQGIAECFVPERTGWVIPRGDHAAFRAALTRLMALNESERAAMGDAAARYARTTFDPQRQVAAYLELFQKLVSSRT